jgi:hypothetical protein
MTTRDVTSERRQRLESAYRQCRPLAEAWREFVSGFTSRNNLYGWHVFFEEQKRLAEAWREFVSKFTTESLAL